MKTFTLVLVVCIFLSCGEKKDYSPDSRPMALVPEPALISLGKGTFRFNDRTIFVVNDTAQEKIAKDLAKRFSEAAGFEPRFTNIEPESNYLRFNQDKALPQEAYRLNITESKVEISANSYSGFLYGTGTLRQLLPLSIENSGLRPQVDWSVPVIRIEDAPRFTWRGLMLDVSRHFFDKEYILKTIDRMAMFKLNTLHLHLVDDQGWRMEIDQYPKLTEIGAYRVDQEDKHWDARTWNSPKDKGTYGGYYTKENLLEIVAYAKKHGIAVMPEIEMPAHVMSALAAYPEFSCFGESIAVPSGGVWPITDIYCPGKDTTFEFLENVLTEVMEIFPSKYIHVGGDEATRTNWEKCPNCRRRMREEGLKNTAELQTYFIQRMERFLSDNDRILVGWDEIIEGGLPSGATVMSWRGIEGGWEASKEGHDVIMTPNTVYLNQYQGEPDYEPIAFGGYVPLNQVYGFDPVVDTMSLEQKKHILGSQANLWSEFITNENESEYMLYPRLAALSEALWTPKDKKDWARFSKKIPAIFKRFDVMGINYSRSSYAVTAKSELNADGSISVELQNEFPESRIWYGVNEEAVSAPWKLYTNPLKFKKTTTIRAAVFENGKTVGDTLIKTFNFHKAVGKKVTYEPQYNERYQGTGESTLVNVLRGSKNFHDGKWLAWLEDNPEITIDLGKPTSFTSVTVGAMENQGSGIYHPIKIEVSTSENGTDFMTVGTMERTHQPNGFVDLKDFKMAFEQQSARWIRIEVTNLAHPPTGGSCFLFIDEILVD